MTYLILHGLHYSNLKSLAVRASFSCSIWSVKYFPRYFNYQLLLYFVPQVPYTLSTIINIYQDISHL